MTTSKESPALIPGCRAWAVHPGTRKKWRVKIVNATATHATVADLYPSGEVWTVAIVDLTPIVDSGESGLASVAMVKETFSAARKHLSTARRMMRENVEPASIPPPAIPAAAPGAAARALPRIHRRLVLRALRALPVEEQVHWRRYIDVPDANNIDDAIAAIVASDREWY